jgi:hypothetical protein
MFIRGRDQKCDVLVQPDIIICSQVTDRTEPQAASPRFVSLATRYWQHTWFVLQHTSVPAAATGKKGRSGHYGRAAITVPLSGLGTVAITLPLSGPVTVAITVSLSRLVTVAITVLLSGPVTVEITVPLSRLVTVTITVPLSRLVTDLSPRRCGFNPRLVQWQMDRFPITSVD